MSQAIFSPVPQIRIGVSAQGFVERAMVAIRAAVPAALREWELRRDARILEGLDARALADIGIGPGQAEAAVRFGRSSLGRHRVAAERPGEPAPLMPLSWTEWR